MSAAMKPIAIVSFGSSTDPWVFHTLEKKIQDWVSNSWDVKTLLSDPLQEDRVRHTENGTFPKTIVAVVGQEQWSGNADFGPCRQ